MHHPISTHHHSGNEAFDRLVEEVARLDRLSVAAPLRLCNGPGGKTLSIAMPRKIPGLLFVVNLTQNSGANGTNTTAATWTYNVTDLAGKSLGTNLSPQRPRAWGTAAAATMGMGYFDTSGVFYLAEAWETAGSGGCPT